MWDPHFGLWTKPFFLQLIVFLVGPTLWVDNWEGREIEKDGKCGHDFAVAF